MKNTSSSSFNANKKDAGKAGEMVGVMVDRVVQLCEAMLRERPPLRNRTKL